MLLIPLIYRFHNRALLLLLTHPILMLLLVSDALQNSSCKFSLLLLIQTLSCLFTISRLAAFFFLFFFAFAFWLTIIFFRVRTNDLWTRDQAVLLVAVYDEVFRVDLPNRGGYSASCKLKIHSVIEWVKITYVLTDLVSHNTFFLVEVLRGDVHRRIVLFVHDSNFFLAIGQVGKILFYCLFLELLALTTDASDSSTIHICNILSASKLSRKALKPINSKH